MFRRLQRLHNERRKASGDRRLRSTSCSLLGSNSRSIDAGSDLPGLPQSGTEGSLGDAHSARRPPKQRSVTCDVKPGLLRPLWFDGPWIAENLADVSSEDQKIAAVCEFRPGMFRPCGSDAAPWIPWSCPDVDFEFEEPRQPCAFDPGVFGPLESDGPKNCQESIPEIQAAASAHPATQSSVGSQS
eukprot:TRINITY_DN110865_c0_g1_i1.p1 TRINITY_DN110865_c0_g1~~TRINITY_DN110865_c0_g1_i1.p1  ORF type:complete len:186 (+),score=25.88 TRINITY_DN110865_c0_g1_i1:46-603(+)